MAPPSVQTLTTIFTPAASCLEDIYQWSTTTTGEPAGEELKYLSLGPWPPNSCMPTGWAVTSQFYSPGVCPAGYTVACLSLATVGTVTETRATCCPSLYQCQTETGWPWYSTNRCTVTASMLPSLRATVTSIDMIASTTETFLKTLGSVDGINANAVSIRFQAKDFPSNTGYMSPTSTTLSSRSIPGLPSTSNLTPTSNVPSAVSTPSGSSISSSISTTSLDFSTTSSLSLKASLTPMLNLTTSTVSPPPVSSSITSHKSSSTSSSSPSISDSISSTVIATPASTSASSQKSSSGMSSGSKAGMGVGLGVGGLLVLALVILMFQRGKNNANKSPKRSLKYWYGTGPARLGVPVELAVSRSRHWHELGNDRAPVELQGDWGHRSRSWN